MQAVAKGPRRDSSGRNAARRPVTIEYGCRAADDRLPEPATAPYMISTLPAGVVAHFPCRGDSASQASSAVSVRLEVQMEARVNGYSGSIRVLSETMERSRTFPTPIDRVLRARGSSTWSCMRRSTRRSALLIMASKTQNCPVARPTTAMARRRLRIAIGVAFCYDSRRFGGRPTIPEDSRIRPFRSTKAACDVALGHCVVVAPVARRRPPSRARRQHQRAAANGPPPDVVLITRKPIEGRQPRGGRRRRHCQALATAAGAGHRNWRDTQHAGAVRSTRATASARDSGSTSRGSRSLARGAPARTLD